MFTLVWKKINIYLLNRLKKREKFDRINILNIRKGIKMEKEKIKGIIEAILFSAGRVVKVRELMSLLELNSDEIIGAIAELEQEYSSLDRGLEIVRVEDGYQLASKKEYHEYIYPMISKAAKPTLSQASLEVLSIIAYNSRATKTDVDTIRGVDSSASIYRLLEYNLIEQAGKADLPGKPMTYKVTDEFLKMFGLKSIKDLPELPKYKLDSNRQIVIDELEEDNSDKKAVIDETKENNLINIDLRNKTEAPVPQEGKDDNT